MKPFDIGVLLMVTVIEIQVQIASKKLQVEAYVPP